MTTLEILWVVGLPIATLLLLALLGGAGRGAPALPVAAAVLAAAGLFGSLAKARQQWEIARFAPVEATVVVSERGRRANEWSFAYEYAFEGKRWRSSRFGHRPRLRGRRDTDHLAETHPVGRRFTAFVDPSDPGRAVVDPRPGYALPAAALVLYGALGVAAAAALRRGRPPAPPEGGSRR